MTLIELLAALLIAGMLTGWGVGQWRHHQQTLRLEHTAQQLLAFLLRLQADANWRNRTTLLWFRTARPGAWAGCAAAGLRFRRGFRFLTVLSRRRFERLHRQRDWVLRFAQYRTGGAHPSQQRRRQPAVGAVCPWATAFVQRRAAAQGHGAMLTLERGFTLPEVMLALVFGSVIALGAAKRTRCCASKAWPSASTFGWSQRCGSWRSALRKICAAPVLRRAVRRPAAADRPGCGRSGGQLRYRRLRHYSQRAMAHFGRGCRLFRLPAAQWRLGRAARREPMRWRWLGAATRP